MYLAVTVLLIIQYPESLQSNHNPKNHFLTNQT